MKLTEKNKNKAFTLIELLVVIAIIGLLASIVLVATNGARSKARDANRRESVKQVATALELYYSDNNSYPSTGGSWYGTCSAFGSHPASTGANAYIPNLAPTYIAQLPTDPLNPASSCSNYVYSSNGTDYFFMAYLSVENCSNISSDPMRRPAYPTQCDYTSYTSGAANW